MIARRVRSFCLVTAAALFVGSFALAQDDTKPVTPASSAKPGKLKMKVKPKQAYTFVDGRAIGPGNRSVKLGVGTHHVVVANYGYKFAEQDVSIDSKKTLPLDIKLETVGAPVSGPRGRIQIESGRGLPARKWFGGDDAAVLLTGTKPDYFVGHVDEFNHDIIWRQELLVPPGTHLVTVTRFGTVLWSGPITVGENERVILNVSTGKRKTTPWDRGPKLAEQLPRFKAGVASTTVVVAPVSASLSANPSNINCGQSTQLAWNSKETVEADMSGMSPVPTSGERTVSPKQTTEYKLTASGPGGVATPSTTVDVNTAVQASLNVSSVQVTYHRIGDKILEQPNATLNWSATNADSVTLDTVGSVETSGSRSFPITPKQTANGPIDEQLTYTLKATNSCGGSDTKTVSVHLTGVLEPLPSVTLQSVFFPTDYPAKDNPELGLLPSQQEVLTNLATQFKKYLEYDPDAKLSLDAYTDERGSKDYNQSLSETRAQSVKDYLVSQGVPADKIDSSALGKEKQLDKAEVSNLVNENPNQAPEKQARNQHGTWLAYNRRVDIMMSPTNAQSEQFYPNEAPDFSILWQIPKPSRQEVEGSNAPPQTPNHPPQD